MLQVAWTLWNMVRGVCDDQIDFGASDTLMGGCFGHLGRGPRWDQLFRQRADAGKRPDVVVLGAGAHIYKTRCGFRAFSNGPASACTPGPMRCTHPDHERFKRAQFFLANNKLAPEDAERARAELSVAEHVDALRYILRVVLKQISQLRDEFGVNGTAAPEFVWKSQSPAHPDCFRWGANGGPLPQPFAGYQAKDGNRTRHIHNWAAFPHFDRAARDAAASSDGLLHYMDSSMLYERPDGHIMTDEDCLHYCTPGPLDELARVLQHLLLTQLPVFPAG